MYHPRDVHFRNQRIKEALYTDFGANRGTQKNTLLEGYNTCNLSPGQNTTPERYIFVMSASRRPYITILGQIERPQKSAAGKLEKVETLVTCDRGKIPPRRGTFSYSAHQGGPLYRFWGKSKDLKNLLLEG